MIIRMSFSQEQPKATPSMEGFSPEEKIRRCGTFEELYTVLDEVGSITTSLRTYTADEIKTIINEVRRGLRAFTFITKTYNLREKVKMLLPGDTGTPQTIILH